MSNTSFAGTCTCASKGELVTEFADEHSGEDLSEDEQQKFFNLLHKYADIFAGSVDDLGRTSKLKHRIDAGTTPPIQRPVLRISLQTERGSLPDNWGYAEQGSH